MKRDPKPLLDKTGIRIGKLTAIKMIERDPVMQRHIWQFQCDCGTFRNMNFRQIKLNKWTSCGCDRKLRGWNLKCT